VKTRVEAREEEEAKKKVIDDKELMRECNGKEGKRMVG
jgi:hypothetical protein